METTVAEGYSEAEIEFVARAICAVHGLCPDDVYLNPGGSFNPHRWTFFKEKALEHLAAAKAIKIVEAGRRFPGGRT